MFHMVSFKFVLILSDLWEIDFHDHWKQPSEACVSRLAGHVLGMMSMGGDAHPRAWGDRLVPGQDHSERAETGGVGAQGAAAAWQPRYAVLGFQCAAGWRALCCAALLPTAQPDAAAAAAAGRVRTQRARVVLQ